MADTIYLQQVFEKASVDEFWAVRGKAIQAYANIEQSLCQVFASLSGTPLDVAGIIFFKIVNAGTLYGILEKLQRKKHGATYSLFWNSFLKTMRHDISEMRNQIVHWNAVNVIGDTGYTGLVLRQPNLWDLGPNSPPPITTAGMQEFIVKCDFFAPCQRIQHSHYPGQLHAAGSGDAANMA